MPPSPHTVGRGTTGPATSSHYTCAPRYWSILNPLEGATVAPSRMKRQLHDALHESFHFRGLPTPPLPTFRSLPQIAIQRDNPRSLWSCGTFAMSTTLHILSGGTPPHSLPTQFITRDDMMALHRALLGWLILGIPQPLGQPLPSQGYSSPSRDTHGPLRTL